MKLIRATEAGGLERGINYYVVEEARNLCVGGLVRVLFTFTCSERYSKVPVLLILISVSDVSCTET